MTFYIKQNNIYRIEGNEEIDIRNELPPYNYVIQKDAMSGRFYLEHVADFTMPAKVYGDVSINMDRIIRTYQHRSASTGVLLTGEKGSGKTMLAKSISINLSKEKIPTLIVNECFHGDDFNKFIQSIDQPCVILFDEFEKVYALNKQEHILTLLDGVFPTKKLFIFTSNESYKINDHLFNRPGRIFYSIQYSGLSVDFIKEYCEDNLNNKMYITQLCKISMLFAAFNFDLLQSIVEEMNRYNEAPKEALRILNATPETSDDNRFIAELIIEGIQYNSTDLYDNGEWYGNPLNPRGITMQYCKKDGGDEDIGWDWVNCNVDASDLTNINIAEGLFEFKNSNNEIVKLRKQQTKRFHYGSF